MKNKRTVIVGIFIFIGLIIFAITILTLGGQKKTFVKSFPIHAIFNDVNGLLDGGNVWFSGVKVGTVKKIAFHGDSDVEVTMNIDLNAESHIHKDAKAKIGSDGLIGNKIVIIYGGTLASPQVKKNDFLAVENGLSTDDMMATLQANNKNLMEITTDFKNISRKIDSGKGILATLLNDPALSSKIQVSATDLQATLANLKTVSESSKEVLGNLQAFSGKMNTKGNSINDLATDTLMYQKIKLTINQLNVASGSLNKLTENLQMASEKFNQKNNTVGLLLNDASTAKSMEATLKNLESGSKKLDQDLEALQHNIFFRGFFKKKK
ncbi:MlaD family protein [Lacihabitans sp. LS3-19]|uniref:MlaD family protein n=1 Tax=Lacihabitans sp. LS3-19 TaxID=2487335 RepID=UPI0020CF30E4|nr:MlaD family protein [Lacihabitans sp. LS3-19]